MAVDTVSVLHLQATEANYFQTLHQSQHQMVTKTMAGTWSQVWCNVMIQTQPNL